MPIGPLSPVVSPAHLRPAGGEPGPSSPPSSQRFGAHLIASPSPALVPGRARDPAVAGPLMPVARVLVAHQPIASAIASADVSLVTALHEADSRPLRTASPAGEHQVRRIVPPDTPDDRMSHAMALRV